MKRAIYLLIPFFISACTSSPSINQPIPNEKKLRINLGAEPSLLNPLLSTDSASSSVEGFLFNGLMKVSKDLDMEPDLAHDVIVSKQNTRYVFKLKKNVTWHDGKPFTAHDVKFTFDLLMDPKTNTVRRSNYFINEKPIRFTILDSYTIQADLPQPFAPFMIHMSMGILPKHLLSDTDINISTFNRNPIGTGPFKFKTWKSGQHIHLTKNENYFGMTAKISNILLKIIPDERTSLIAFQKEELDVSKIPKKDFKAFQRMPNFQTFHYQDLRYTFLAFNLTHPDFKNKAVRQAIAHSINKESLIKGVLKGFGHVANLPNAPISWAYPNDQNIKKYAYNPERSRTLLREAGYTWNTKKKIFMKNGTPLAFTVITNKGNKDREKSALIIQQFLREIGIKMNIQLMEWSSFIKLIGSPKTPKPFDAIMLGWSLGLDPDPYAVWHSSQYPKGFNLIAYNNPEVDHLIETGRRQIKSSDRKKVYTRLYQEIAYDLPYIFLYYPDVLTGIQNRVKGLAPPGPVGLLNPIENIYISQ